MNTDPSIPRAIDPDTNAPFSQNAPGTPETKPWWKSSIMLSSIAGLLLYALRHFGLDTAKINAADIENVLSEIGGVVLLIITIWSRIKGNSKPISAAVLPKKASLFLFFLLPSILCLSLSSCKTVDALMANAGITWADVGRVAKEAGIKAGKVFVFDFKDGVVDELGDEDSTSAKTVIVIAPAPDA